MGKHGMVLTLYGIKSCDTMKKARTWLDTHKIAYAFHDYKVAGIDAKRVTTWCDALGWETVLNRAGTTFRKLSDADKTNIDQKKAVALMVAQPSMIKRPILDHGGKFFAGFKPEIYKAALL